MEKSLKILMQNRSNALSHPGGDTVVMERIAACLRQQGHEVVIDVEGRESAGSFDLVHLFNFVTADITRQYAERAWEAKTPYVVTTMYEDWPIFFKQMAVYSQALKAYHDSSYSEENWKVLAQAAEEDSRVGHPCPDNSWTAEHSAALICTGGNEAKALKRDYPNTPCIEQYRCGFEVGAENDGGERFRKETGLEDFVLCVGRLEERKNQLMLLKALEQSDITLVFVAGGFTYRPDYERLCRSFKRKGKTVFLGRVEPGMLASAYAASRAHVLPSWYELPGLVSLEAAHFGTNIVVTDYGTPRDYFSKHAFYCQPRDPESIANAVTAAFYTPRRKELSAHVENFTWENATKRNLEIYRQVIEKHSNERSTIKPEVQQEASPLVNRFSRSIQAAEVGAHQARGLVARIPEVVGEEPSPEADYSAAKCLCIAGDALQREDDMDGARRKYEEALACAPKLPRAHRSLGVLSLRSNMLEEAKSYFSEALRYDPQDTRSLLGLGAVDWEYGNKEEALSLYLKAADGNPSDPSVLIHLVNACYSLNRPECLEKALVRYLEGGREKNLHIQYCLAGCYFRQRKFDDASRVIETMLAYSPAHSEALELKKEIEKSLNEIRQQDCIVLNEESVVKDSELGRGLKAMSLDARASSGIEELSSKSSFHSRWENTAEVSRKIKLLEGAKAEKEYDDVIEFASQLLAQGSLDTEQEAQVRILRAESWGCTGEVVQAAEEFAKYESHTRLGVRALIGRGAICASQEKWEDAHAFFKKALIVDHMSDLAAAGAGICLVSLENKYEAWHMFEKALLINPENIQSLHGLIQLGYDLGRLIEIEEHISRYLNYSPGNTSMLYSYAGCLFALGRNGEAEKQIDKILVLKPQDERALELLEEIRKITVSRETQTGESINGQL